MVRLTLILTVLMTVVTLLGGFKLLLNEWRAMREQRRLTGRWLVLLLVLLPFVAGPAQAQLWSGVLDTTRATDWTNAGVTGGIPTTRTQCGSTISAYTGTSSTINTAINACGTDQYVLLGAGTFNLSNGITFNGNSDVTLRGAGPDQTFLVFTNDDACQGQRANICLPGNDLGYYAPGPPTHSVTWSAGFSQGTTVVTLSATTGLSVGMYLVLDGLDGGINSDDIVNCSVITTCTTESGGDVGANQRAGGRMQREMLLVTNINGTNITVEHGLRFPNWSSVSTKQAWWGNSGSMAGRNGIEDLSLDTLNGQANTASISFLFQHDSWVKNIRILYAPAPRAYVILYQAAHITIRDSYFYGSVSEVGGPTHYGIEAFPAYDFLIENNIFHRRTSPIVLDGAVGGVMGYNLCINDYYGVSPTFMQACYYSHEGGNGYNLWEGNVGPGFKADVVHASSNLNTSFRGYYRGWEPGKTSETFGMVLYAFQRFYNLIGNVVGTSGDTATYTSCSSASAFGLACAAPASDSYTTTSVMRWGNYDVVNAATRFQSAEVPSGLANYANAVPASNALPSSFYLSSKPAFYGARTWPSIGPDVTNGNVGQCSGGTMDLSAASSVSQCTGGGSFTANVAGGHVNMNPAMDCYLNVMNGPADGSGSALAFNANLCYAASGAISTPFHGVVQRTMRYVEVAFMVLGIGWHCRRALLAGVFVLLSLGHTWRMAVPYHTTHLYQATRQGCATLLLKCLPRDT